MVDDENNSSRSPEIGNVQVIHVKEFTTKAPSINDRERRPVMKAAFSGLAELRI
jgi:hypothetical protein